MNSRIPTPFYIFFLNPDHVAARLLARYANSAAIHLTYVKFAFLYLKFQPAACKTCRYVQILVKKRALARNIYSIPQSTQPNNNFN